ncbi:unnamed protein product [Ceutorhynchus assimilis]|uniref:RRM domain-containing protein n=1 Tax=Ceutorhynchus assimilis TaxID=467358 RepID=A0A9N9MWC1_9CUCU|nr:unnamed protein product [Ceutorhynchus assimilis]
MLLFPSYWYQLLKLVQTHGTIEKFDLIFHRTGPLTGQPRGFAFVTYAKHQDALRAKNCLNGKLVGQKNINVTWAHIAEIDSEPTPKPKPDVTIPALALSKNPKKTDKASQIQAIEAKLKVMEHKEEELKINDSIASKPAVIQQFQFNKDRSSNSVRPYRAHDRQKKPYMRKKSRN